jgi:hypothetical protein
MKIGIIISSNDAKTSWNALGGVGRDLGVRYRWKIVKCHDMINKLQNYGKKFWLSALS